MKNVKSNQFGVKKYLKINKYLWENYKEKTEMIEEEKTQSQRSSKFKFSNRFNRLSGFSTTTTTKYELKRKTIIS